MTVSVENFVKTIYLQGNRTGEETKLGTLAGLLNISNAAATDMARKLAVKHLVHYTKYKPLTLTSTGKELALNVIRKHRLWELFLYNTFGLSLHEIHREAEHLEHLTSDFLADKLDHFLGNPSTDPHGDPIPSASEETATDDGQLLLSLSTAGNRYEICRLFSSDKDFFDFCSANQLVVGSHVFVEKQFVASKMTEIRVNQDKILLNKEFTDNIYVKPIFMKS